MTSPAAPDGPSVQAASPADLERAETLARALELNVLPVEDSLKHLAPVRLVLRVAADGLSLASCGRGAPGPVTVDFADPGMRHRRKGGQNELLGRAVGLRADRIPGVLDTTAGLGRDAFVLADLGCAVTLCERNAVVCALLEDGLARAREHDDEWLRSVASRMALHAGDASKVSATTLERTDVIYLDPMFPTRDKSASVKKEMAVLQRLLNPAAGEGETLLDWAVQQPVRRVVVKRPPRAPLLANRPCSHQIIGKAVRFDVYMLG